MFSFYWKNKYNVNTQMKLYIDDSTKKYIYKILSPHTIKLKYDFK